MKEDKQKHSKNNGEKEETTQPEPSSEAGQEAEEGPPMVALTFDEYDSLEKEIETLQAEIEDKTDQFLRTRADFENYKKRVLRDATRSQQDAMINVVKIFLVISDDLERALKNKPEGKDKEGWISGIELIYQKLLNLMKNQGVERMTINIGDEFDPTIHEAITQEDHPELEEGQIIEVVQPGYRISDRIIRPAMVRVAR